MRDIESLSEIDYPKMLALKVFPHIILDIQVRTSLRHSKAQGLGRNKIPACPATKPKRGKGDFLGPRGRNLGQRPHQSHRPQLALPPFLLHAIKLVAKSQEGNNGQCRRHVALIWVISPANNRGRTQYLREEVMIFYELGYGITSLLFEIHLEAHYLRAVF